MTLAVPENISAPSLISDSPTSVLITWLEPALPNDVLDTYTIERRQQSDTGQHHTTEVIVNASQPTSYLDDSQDISPNTDYEYRIIASSVTGDGYSPWANVTTRASS